MGRWRWMSGVGEDFRCRINILYLAFRRLFSPLKRFPAPGILFGPNERVNYSIRLLIRYFHLFIYFLIEIKKTKTAGWKKQKKKKKRNKQSYLLCFVRLFLVVRSSRVGLYNLWWIGTLERWARRKNGGREYRKRVRMRSAFSPQLFCSFDVVSNFLEKKNSSSFLFLFLFFFFRSFVEATDFLEFSIRIRRTNISIYW